MAQKNKDENPAIMAADAPSKTHPGRVNPQGHTQGGGVPEKRNVLHSVSDSIRWFFSILWSAAYRFYFDDCFSRAAALAYTSLFALVPMTALCLSMFGVFGIRGEDTSRMLQTILEQVLPVMTNETLVELQEQVFTSLAQFSLNVRALNTVSIAALVFTSVALLNTIESALNVVWRTTSNLSLLSKLTSFWAVLTLGPLLIAVSIYWTTKVEAFGFAEEFTSFYYLLVSHFVPTTVTTLGLGLLFYKLPAARVRMVDAVFGALIAAVLFEFIKRAFAYYIGVSSTYSTIYGVVASFPLFLFWLYVAWVVVLFGAEISYQSSSAHILSGLRRYSTDLGEVGAILGLRILLSIARRFLRGDPPPTESELSIDCGANPEIVRTCLNALSDARLLSAADEVSHTRHLMVAPDRITVGTVLDTFRSKDYRNRIRMGLEQSASNDLLDLFRKGGLNRYPNDLNGWTVLELVQMKLHGDNDTPQKTDDEPMPESPGVNE